MTFLCEAASSSLCQSFIPHPVTLFREASGPSYLPICAVFHKAFTLRRDAVRRESALAIVRRVFVGVDVVGGHIHLTRRR